MGGRSTVKTGFGQPATHPGSTPVTLQGREFKASHIHTRHDEAIQGEKTGGQLF
jgi:hypothetical protein